MAILVDLNQVLISNLMQQINSGPKMVLEEDIIRHMVLNSLRSYSRQFKSKYGDLIICCDSKKYWRRDIFPFYKSQRREAREKSPLDWNMIFETLNKVRDELKENFPYRVIEVEGAEADDIIGVLSEHLPSSEDILILSSDKDFAQLQVRKNITQYSPILKRFIKTENPRASLMEHIIRGDRGDGIPNFLSPDNIFAIGERQKAINSKKLAEWMTKDPEDFCTTEMLRGYKRNQMLIDLSFVPETIRTSIVQAYENIKPNSRQKLFNYLFQNRLTSLIEVIDEF